MSDTCISGVIYYLWSSDRKGHICLTSNDNAQAERSPSYAVLILVNNSWESKWGVFLLPLASAGWSRRVLSLYALEQGHSYLWLGLRRTLECTDSPGIIHSGCLFFTQRSHRWDTGLVCNCAHFPQKLMQAQTSKKMAVLLAAGKGEKNSKWWDLSSSRKLKGSINRLQYKPQRLATTSRRSSLIHHGVVTFHSWLSRTPWK